jgi:hypothetical protein
MSAGVISDSSSAVKPQHLTRGDVGGDETSRTCIDQNCRIEVFSQKLGGRMAGGRRDIHHVLPKADHVIAVVDYHIVSMLSFPLPADRSKLRERDGQNGNPRWLKAANATARSIGLG